VTALKWIKKNGYFILLIGMGVVYLSLVDHWQIYAGLVTQVEGWQESFLGEEGKVKVTELLSADFVEAMADSSLWVRLSDNGESSEAREDSLEDIEQSQGEGDTAGGDGGGGEEAGGPSFQNPEDSAPEEPGEPAEPVYCTVEDDYFADAVFIGDSRTVGMFEYGGLEEISTFYASTGLTVYKIFDSKIVTVPGEKQKITVEEALQNNSFAKIYLMIGINEMGMGTVESFLEKYREVVAHLQELQPDAIIYLQAIMKVTAERSGQGDYINNEGIAARNEGIAQMADNVRIFYLDVNPFICDDEGGLVPDYTFDGVHLKARYIDIWKDFLKTHAISS